MTRTPFIEPSAPVLKREPPTGPEWLHEIKHDGWRAQLHLREGNAVIYSRNGTDLTCRFRPIAEALPRLLIPFAVIDAEIVACDETGAPSFGALMTGARHGCCAYCFDLMMMDARDIRTEPLAYRRAVLQRLLKKARLDTLRFSEDFPDPEQLLAACSAHGLEGIVSKLKTDQYRSGTNRGWIKVKTPEWRAAHNQRWRRFTAAPR